MEAEIKAEAAQDPVVVANKLNLIRLKVVHTFTEQNLKAAYAAAFNTVR